MPAQRKIGAVIGLEGAREYTRSVKEIVSVTKAMEAGLKSVGKQMESESRTISDANNLRKKLSATIEVYNQKLSKQLEMQQKLPALYQNAQIKAKGYEERLKDIERTQGKSSDAYKELAKAQAENEKVLNNAVSLYNEYEKEIQETNATIQQHKNELESIPSALKMVTDAYKNASNELTEWGSAIKGIGSFMTKYVTAPIMAGATAGVKFATDWETAFTGVQKTVSGSKEEFDALAQEINRIALSTGSTREEIAGVAEAAGQLGIGIQDVAKFAETVVMLGDTTNISAEEGAVAIAQFMNIMQESTDTVGDFGNVLVELGNNMATDENSILMLATRLASAGKLVGLTTPEVLALSAAMSSVGLTAEAGGTAMSTTMKMISKDVATGGENLQLFAEITGQTAEEFAETWRSNPMEALQDFIIGLSNLDGGSEAVIQMLDELGFAGIRQSDALQRLTLDYDGLTRAVEMANEEYTKGSALTDEAKKKYETFGVQLNQLKESFKIFASLIGETLIDMLKPAVEGLTTLFQNLSNWWAGLSEPMQKFLIAIGGIVAAIGPLLVIGGNMLIWAGRLKAALTTLGGTATLLAPLSTAFSTIISSITNFAFAHPVLLGITAGVTAFAIAAKKLGITWEDVKGVLGAVWDATKEAWSIFVNAVNDGVDRIMAFIDMMLHFYYDSFTAIRDYIGGLLTDAWQWGVDMFQNIANGMSSVASTVYNAVVNGLSSAWQYIADKVSEAWGWGSDLMSNLASGIASGVSWVIERVKAVASSIWSYLHFSEPETGPLANFNTWMPDMMKQMAKGINDNSWMVEDAINNVAGRMSIDPTTNSYNYGGVVINLQVPEGANGQMIVDDIEEELANRTMRRRAVFG